MQKVLNLSDFDITEFLTGDQEIEIVSANIYFDVSDISETVESVVETSENLEVDAVVMGHIPPVLANPVEQKLLESEIVPLYLHDENLVMCTPHWGAIFSNAERLTPTKNNEGFDVDIQTLY